MDLGAVRRELAELLASTTNEHFPEGFHVYVYGRVPPSPQLPAAIVVWPDSVDYNNTLNGGTVIELPVTFAFAAADFEVAQENIDAVMSTPGYIDAMQDHRPAAPAAWKSLVVTLADNVRPLLVGEGEVLGVDVHVEILA